MAVMSKDSQDPVNVSRALLAERRALLAKGRELIAQKHELQRRFTVTQGARPPLRATPIGMTRTGHRAHNLPRA